MGARLSTGRADCLAALPQPLIPVLPPLHRWVLHCTVTHNTGQCRRAFGALPTYGAGHRIPACPHRAMGKETLGQAATAQDEAWKDENILEVGGNSEF